MKGMCKNMDRPKLDAVRNKDRRYSHNHRNFSNNRLDNRRGQKRTHDNTDYQNAPAKKPYTNTDLLFSPSKNIANNRLRCIREIQKKELETLTSLPSTTSKPSTEKKDNDTHTSQIKSQNRNDTPPKKNLAVDRLKNLRRSITNDLYKKNEEKSEQIDRTSKPRYSSGSDKINNQVVPKDKTNISERLKLDKKTSTNVPDRHNKLSVSNGPMLKQLTPQIVDRSVFKLRKNSTNSTEISPHQSPLKNNNAGEVLSPQKEAYSAYNKRSSTNSLGSGRDRISSISDRLKRSPVKNSSPVSNQKSNTPKIKLDRSKLKGVYEAMKNSVTHMQTSTTEAKNNISDRLKISPVVHSTNSQTKDISKDSPKGPITPKSKIADRLKIQRNTNNNIKNEEKRPAVIALPYRSLDPISDTSMLCETIINKSQEVTETLPAPTLFNDSVDKTAFTKDWIMHTNFDGNSTSIMEASINATASDTVANLDTIAADEAMDWTTDIQPEKVFSGKPVKSRDLCIVVDTNIFIHDLDKIRSIIRIKVAGPLIPIIFMPWMVLQELDFIKDTTPNQRLKDSVTQAIRYINVLLGKEKTDRFIGQTTTDAERQKIIGKSPDDKIIACCLQVKENYENVMLLSNDVNLKNKALIHDISACSSSEVLMRVMIKLNVTKKYKAITSKMGMICSFIAVELAKAVYGNAYSQRDLLNQATPWNFTQCLRIFKRYWAEIFRKKLLKQFTKVVDDLSTMMNKSKVICDDSPEYSHYFELCLNLCIFLKDIEESRELVIKTISDIKQLNYSIN